MGTVRRGSDSDARSGTTVASTGTSAPYARDVHPKLQGLDEEDLVAVLTHRTQAWAVNVIASLLTNLRRCNSPEDYFEFQADLFQQVIAVDETRSEVRRTLKRVTKGRRLRPVLLNQRMGELSTIRTRGESRTL